MIGSICVSRWLIPRKTSPLTRQCTKTFDRLNAVLPGVAFVGVYGSTEGGNFVMTTSSGEEERERPGTIGRPLFSFDVAILDPSDVELGPGQEGELGVRGPSTMTEYWKLPDATAETLRNGWLHTGT